MKKLFKNGAFQNLIYFIIGAIVTAIVAIFTAGSLATTYRDKINDTEKRSIENSSNTNMNTGRLIKMETLMGELQKGQVRIENKLDKILINRKE